MTIGQTTDALDNKLQAMVEQNKALVNLNETFVKQNEASTAILEELLEVVRQRPTQESTDLHALGERIIASMGDLQTTMAAIIERFGPRTYVRSHPKTSHTRNSLWIAHSVSSTIPGTYPCEHGLAANSTQVVVRAHQTSANPCNAVSSHIDNIKE